MAYAEKESYKHKMAKEVFRQWCAEEVDMKTDIGMGIAEFICCSNSGYRTAVEYPIVNNKQIDSTTQLWDESTFCYWLSQNEGADPKDYDSSWAPTYEECIKHGHIPIAIVDLMVPYKGMPSCFIEICHTNPITQEKVDKIMDINPHLVIFEIDADWILNQTKRPDIIKVKNLY